MQVTIEINNPHWQAAVEDMAAAVGLDAQTLCVGLVEKQLAEYEKEIREAKLSAAVWRLSDRLNRLILEQKEKEDDSNA